MIHSIISIKKTIVQILDILPPRQKKELLLLFISMVLEASLELLGVSLIFPFINLMSDERTFVDNVFFEWIYHIGLKTHMGYILFTGFLIIFVFFIKNVIAILCTYYRLDYAKRFKVDVSSYILESYLGRGYEFFLKTNSAIIQRNLTEDVVQVYELIIRLLEMVAAIITTIVLGIYLIALDAFIAIGELIIIGICFLIITFGFKSRIKKAGESYRKAYSELVKCNYEVVGGIKEIMVLGREERAMNQFKNCAEAEGKARLTDMFFHACPDRIIEGVSIGGFIGMVCLRLYQGTQIDTIVPILAAFALGAFKILNNVSKISTRINAVIYRQAALNDCHRNIIEIKSKEFDSTGLKNSSSKSKKIIQFTNKLTINDISWKYDGDENQVLKDVSLEIKKGESIAFIGASGAGKSTLGNIILGLLQPQSGEVRIDGTDIFSNDISIKGIMGYVPQTVFLMDDTIRANVAYMLPASEISEDKVWAALEKAQLAEFVRNLPDGLNTIVGERGIKFSGGQSQRISIARALYEDPDILVLDEATSSLDSETETAVMEAIDRLHGDKTLIIIAHRLSTIQNCDKVYEISGGTVGRVR